LSQLDDPMKRPRDCKFNTDNGILLLDHFDEKAIMLLRSMRDGGFEGPAIMIEEWGFLPEDVFSIYGYYISRPLAKGSIDPEHEGFREGQARFFNQIEIPDYWEIKADGLSGKILDKNKLRGRIFYAPVGRRLVSDVDWLDEKGFARITDHYDSYGLLYSRDYFNKSGEKFARIWFDRGQERIYENYVTGNIVLTLDGKDYIFNNKTEFAIHVLKEIGADGKRIFYNSLSTPLFVSERLSGSPSGNILFWQEAPRDDIPGNMAYILSGQTKTDHIFVQNSESYNRFINLGVSEKKISKLGFSYRFKREPGNFDKALICTNSDDIEGLDILTEKNPAITFYIVSITEMSQKLMNFGSRKNVKLYPTIRKERLESLFKTAGIYLDINHGREIEDAVKSAFLNNMPILAFDDTVHRRYYTAENNIFKDTDSLSKALQDKEGLLFRIDDQKKTAMTCQDYSKFISNNFHL